MNLYFITAPFTVGEGMENIDLWVRAPDEPTAFDLWVEHYELNDGGWGNSEPANGVNYTLAEADVDYADFSIELRKTYADPAPAQGAIDWDTAHRLIVEGM